MSYDIMYNSLFLKSHEGITPVVLMGSSNVYDVLASGKSGRRARNWSCFNCAVGENEPNLMNMIESFTGGTYNEHWKVNGKFQTDEQIVRWMQKGIKEAASIEEVLDFNKELPPLCYCGYWQDDTYHESEMAYVATSEQLDSWILTVRTLRDEMKAKNVDIFPVVRFSIEDIMRPTGKNKTSAVVVRNQLTKDFIGSVTDSSITWVSDINDALRMPRAEAICLTRGRLRWANVKVATAPNTEWPNNAVIQIFYGSSMGYYSAKSSGGKVVLASAARYAKHFKDVTHAERFLSKINFKPGITAKVVEIL